VDLFTEFILKTINLKLEKKYKKYERVKRKETKSKCNEKYLIVKRKQIKKKR
jgi:hypothetical protein